MIFNLAENDTPNSGLFNTGKSIKFSAFGLMDKKEAFADAAKYIDDYNAALAGGKEAYGKIVAEAKLASQSTGDYLESLNGAKGGMDGYKTSLNNLTLAQKAAKVGAVALNAALNMGIMLVATNLSHITI